MSKQELRNRIIQRLNALSDSEREEIARKLSEHFVGSDSWRHADTIGLTISHGIEWDTKPIIESAWYEGKTVCVPKCRPKERQMDFYVIDSYDQLEKVYYQLWEPKPEETDNITKYDIDLLVVPGLVFDQRGFRIGFGGGYYDRFLTDFPNRKLALAASMQIVEKLPVESFDMPVGAIITENGFLQQGGV